MRKKTLQSIRGNCYQYIIVGSGLAGCVHAEQLTKAGKTVLLVEKRNHIAGNIYTERRHGIDTHVYGSHVFHTNIDRVWNYLKEFAEFNDYKHKVLATTGEETVMLPFTMVTFMQIFNVQTIQEVKDIIASEIDAYFNCNIPEIAANFEEQAIMLIGTTVYEKLIKHYTEKQWGRKATELPAEIIKRLPVRWNCDTTYFNNAKFSGIPKKGYTSMCENMLKSNLIDYIQADYIEHEEEIMLCSNNLTKLIFTGQIDELFNYSMGHLEYRSLEFREVELDIESYQGTAVVNFCQAEVPETRCTEHKHYSLDKNVLESKKTILSFEKSVNHVPGQTIPYYPINDANNNELHSQYVKMFAKTYPNGILAGRLALYKYLDMDKVIEMCLSSTDELLLRY